MRLLKTALCLLMAGPSLWAQAPQIPVTGNLGAGGVFPLFNSPAVVFVTDANHTMVYPEMSGSGGFIRVTSSVALTAPRQLIAPPTKGFSFIVQNATTGGQSITVIGASGSGVVIPTGQTVVVASDGADYVTATGSPGTCPIGTCILNAGAVTQIQTQAVGTNAGLVGTSWGINPLFNQSDLFETFGTFSTYTGDTGKGSVNGSVFLRHESTTCDNAGWNLGNYSVFGETLWFLCGGYALDNHMGAKGVAGGGTFRILKFGDGDSNPLETEVETHGGYVALNDEGGTLFQGFGHEGPIGTGTLISGAVSPTVGLTSLPSGFDQPIGVGRLLINSSSGVGVTTTSQTAAGQIDLGGGNFIAVETIGTSVATSTCGTIAGGAIVPTTAYAITSGPNLITITGSNTLATGEAVTLSGYATSTFLNGVHLTVLTASPTLFTAAYTHSVTSATEAGVVTTDNVDTPRQPNNASVAMTFGITLGSGYGGSSTALSTAAGLGFINSFKLSSVGSYTGGVQYVTANLTDPILAGSEVCMGGLAGYVESNTTADNGEGAAYYNYIIGTPAATTAWVASIRAGFIKADRVYDGTVVIRPAAVVRSYTKGSPDVVNVSDNNITFTNGNTLVMPNGISSAFVVDNKKIQNFNPYASISGGGLIYNGTTPKFGGVFRQDSGVADPTQLVEFGPPGTIGHAFTGWRLFGWNASAIVMNNPPTSGWQDGNPLPSSVVDIGCDTVPYCPLTYRIFTDSGAGSNDAHLEVTRVSNIFNFAGNGTPAVLKVNATPVCLQDGTGCQALTLAQIAAGTAPTSSGTYNFANNAVKTSAQSGVDATAASISALLPANTNFYGASVSGTASRLASIAFGNTAFMSVARADGTASSPTAVLSGEQIGGINAWSYDGSAMGGPNASMRYFATENHTSSAHGTKIDWTTTPNLSTTAVSRFTLDQDGGFYAAGATGGDKGAGTGNFTALYVNNAPAVTSVASLASNAVVLGGGSQATKTAAGFTTDGTSVLTLGQAGTSVGGLALANATSGTIQLAPPAGALGTVTVTIPDVTDTLVARATTDTLTNKRITKRVCTQTTSPNSANSATYTFNTDNCDVINITGQTVTITGFTITGTPVDGDALRMSITGTASVPFTLTTTYFEPSGGTALSTTTSSTARLDMGFFINTATSKWRQVAAQ